MKFCLGSMQKFLIVSNACLDKLAATIFEPFFVYSTSDVILEFGSEIFFALSSNRRAIKGVDYITSLTSTSRDRVILGTCQKQSR